VVSESELIGEVQGQGQEIWRRGHGGRGTEVAENLIELFGVWIARASDTDAVVGEVVVHFRNVDFGHVAGRAVF